jgi:hypothetical protein
LIERFTVKSHKFPSQFFVKYKSEKFGLNSKVTVSLQSEKKQGFSSSLDNISGEAIGPYKIRFLIIWQKFSFIILSGVVGGKQVL